MPHLLVEVEANECAVPEAVGQLLGVQRQQLVHPGVADITQHVQLGTSRRLFENMLVQKEKNKIK